MTITSIGVTPTASAPAFSRDTSMPTLQPPGPRARAPEPKAVGVSGATRRAENGPDDGKYAVADSTPIDVAPISDDQDASLRKMEIIKRAGLVPADPSVRNRAVAAHAEAERIKAGADQADQEATEAQDQTRGERWHDHCRVRSVVRSCDTRPGPGCLWPGERHVGRQPRGGVTRRRRSSHATGDQPVSQAGSPRATGEGRAARGRPATSPSPTIPRSPQSGRPIWRPGAAAWPMTRAE